MSAKLALYKLVVLGDGGVGKTSMTIQVRSHGDVVRSARLPRWGSWCSEAPMKLEMLTSG